MKRIAAIMAAIIGLTLAARAGDIVTTNYYAGYVYMPATYTNAGDTGLTVSTAYLAFPLASLTSLTAAQATTDVRNIVYRFVDAFYVAYAASTNKPTYILAERTTGRRASSGTNVNEYTTHTITTTRRRPAALAIPSE